MLLELGRDDWGRNARVGPGKSSSTLALRRSTAMSGRAGGATPDDLGSSPGDGKARRGSVLSDERKQSKAGKGKDERSPSSASS